MPGIHRVPWVSIQEWKDVKQKFSSSDCKDLVRAYQLMLMWEMRCPKLPANVECSLLIAHVLILKANAETSIFNTRQVLFEEENDLQLSYSTAIVRFVNHIMIPTKSSFYTAASEQNIPDWVVNLRHDVSHSPSLPPLPLLEDGVQVAKQWLLDNYWDPQESNMFSVDGSELRNRKEVVLFTPTENALQTGLLCWLVCQERLGGNDSACVSDLSVTERKSLISLKKCLETNGSLKGTKPFLKFMDSYTSSRLKNKTSLQSLASKLHRFLSAMAKKKNVVQTIVETIFDAGFLKSGGENLAVWSPILIILYEIDSMELLLERIFRKLATGSESEKRLAKGWLSVLLGLFENVKKRWAANRRGNNAEDDSSDSNETELQLSIKKPPRLDYKVVRDVLMDMEPTSDTSNVISRYLQFLRPKIGKEARSTITQLVKLYTSDSYEEDQNFDYDDCSMYSVNDLTTEASFISNHDQIVPEANIWSEVDIDIELWNKCPIGLLPHQKEPNLELPEMVWREVTPVTRKRKAVDDIFN